MHNRQSDDRNLYLREVCHLFWLNLTSSEDFPAVQARITSYNVCYTKLLRDAAALPYDEGVFDAVTMSLALFMLPDPDRALAEAHRVLAPGGAFAATVWNWPVPGFEAFYKPYAEFMVTEERLAGSPPLMGVADPGTLSYNFV